MWFRINSPNVANQTIDNETIIINFENGAYYSTEGMGTDIWEQIAQGASVDQIVAAIAPDYVGLHSELENAVRVFVAELQHEALIVPADHPGEMTLVPDAVPRVAQRVLELPVLQRFTDMQDLLLLDPIHDVDEQGWPSTKQ